MVNNANRSGILDGKEAIRDFLGGVSDYRLKKYIADGMPVLITEGSSWLAHRDNLEEFFKKYTRVDSRNMAEKMFVKQKHPANTLKTPLKHPTN